MKDRIREILKNKKYTDYEIFKFLNLDYKESSKFYDVLEEMLKKYELIKVNDRYSLNKYKTGRYIAKKNFGFITTIDNSFDKDYHVSYINSFDAMNDDIVCFEEIDQKYQQDKKSKEARILKILERNIKTIVATVKIKQNKILFFPDDQRFEIYKIKLVNKYFDLKHNQKVILDIVKYPDKKNKVILVKVKEILGKKYEKNMDILTAIANFNVPYKFDEKVEQEAKNINFKLSKKDIKNRLDLRTEMVVTIDGKDAKDFDDAISIKKLENGNYKLGVHIADVSHYVKENSFIDKEARKRSTSIYLVNYVIPMLPFELSNEICSLKPNEDRLSLSVIMEINTKGKVLSYSIKESVINSKYRLVYDDISDILENKASEEIYKNLKEIIPDINLMNELARILQKRRYKRGAIEFNFKESYFEIENDKVVNIFPYETRIANQIIEEFMLIANETIAEYAFWLNTEFIYRTHDYPDDEKMIIFRRQLYNLGIKIKNTVGDIEPKIIQQTLEKIKGTKEEKLLNKMLLRSMKRAKYQKENDIHFGLACKYYTHFTSPIRRYSDLIVHRMIKKIIKNNLNYHYEDLDSTLNSINSNFKRAEELERDVDDMKKAQFIKKFIGEEFDGIISSVTPFGFFVELDNTVEGLVHISKIPYYMIYDENRLMLYNSQISYKIGDKVKIIVEKVNEYTREIDFILCD